MENLTFYGNGMVIKENAKREYTNAHLSYKGLSIIIDYEKILHVYCDAVMNDDTIIPFEIYPYGDGLHVGYVSVGPHFHKVDIAEVLKQIDEADLEL